MSYIGVPEQHQVNFHNQVSEAQKDYSDYLCPTTKENYWETVDYYWPQIKNIVLMFTYLDENELDKWVEQRDPSIASVFNDAWFNAPDNGKIHLIPAWHIFCDLCSEGYLLNDLDIKDNTRA
jgi:hypothetical protein